MSTLNFLPANKLHGFPFRRTTGPGTVVSSARTRRPAKAAPLIAGRAAFSNIDDEVFIGRTTSLYGGRKSLEAYPDRRDEPAADDKYVAT